MSNMKWNTVRGTFSDLRWEGSLDFSHPEGADFTASVASASVKTGIGKRDRHLAEPEFFDAENHPRITLRSSDLMHAAAEGIYLFSGTIEIKGKSQPLTCRIQVSNLDENPVAQTEFTLRREDFDLGPNHGSFIIGEEVRVRVKIVLQPE